MPWSSQIVKTICIVRSSLHFALENEIEESFIQRPLSQLWRNYLTRRVARILAKPWIPAEISLGYKEWVACKGETPLCLASSFRKVGWLATWCPRIACQPEDCRGKLGKATYRSHINFISAQHLSRTQDSTSTTFLQRRHPYDPPV